MYNSLDTKAASPLEWKKKTLSPSLRQTDTDTAPGIQSNIQTAPGAQPRALAGLQTDLTQKVGVQSEGGIRTQDVDEASRETNILKEVATVKAFKNEIFKAALANVATESGSLKRVEGSGKRFALESAEHRRALEEKIVRVNELMRELTAESEARKLAVEGYRAKVDQLDGELVSKSEMLNESRVRIAELEKKIVTKNAGIV